LRLWNTDARKLVITQWTGPVWDVESGKTVLAIRTRLSFVEETIIHSPDTTMIATGGSNKENVFLEIRDANTGKLLKAHESQRTRKILDCLQCLALAWDESTLISGSLDHLVRSDVEYHHLASKLDRAHRHYLWYCKTSEWPYPCKRIPGQDGAIVGPREWPAHRVALPTYKTSELLAISTDGNLLATGGWDNNACS
jgi:WD40 repeat protein